MRTVEDADGRRALLVKRSGDAWLVRDPRTGRESYRPAADLSVVDDADALSTAAAGVPAPVRRVLTAVRTDRQLGLLLDLVDRGPVPARTLVAATGYCESDLVGIVGEFRAAGLVATTDVAGDPAYDATDIAREAATLLRPGGDGGGTDRTDGTDGRGARADERR
jgi:hypothetical protein